MSPLRSSPSPVGIATRHPLVRGLAIGPGQDPDGEPAGRHGAPAGRRHHAAEPAADDDRAAFGELAAHRLGVLELPLGRLAGADHRDIARVRHLV